MSCSCECTKRDSETKGQDKGDGSKKKGAREGLLNDFDHSSATELERFPEVTLEDVTEVVKELLGE